VSSSEVVVSDWMEGSMAAIAVRKRYSVIEGILTDVIVRHRRTLTREKWEEGKKVFD